MHNPVVITVIAMTSSILTRKHTYSIITRPFNAIAENNSKVDNCSHCGMPT
jgi:hypothetical protein